MSAREAESVTLNPPVQGQGAEPLESLRGQLDRLAASDDRFDNVGREEGKLQDATYVARVDALTLGDMLNAFDLSSCQRVEPLVSLCDEDNEILIGTNGKFVRQMRFMTFESLRSCGDR